MRAILATLLVVGLLAAPFALAARNGHADAATEARGRSAEMRAAHGNHTDDDANRTAKAAAHRTALDGLLAGMKDVRLGCHAEKADHENATRDGRRAWAHCVRDGYRALFELVSWGRFRIHA